MRKITVLLIIISLSLLLPISSVYAENIMISENSARSAAVLEALGFLWDDFNPHAGLTRENLASAVMKISGIKAQYSYSGENYFSDVSGKAAADVYGAVELGILGFMRGESFYPEKYVTYNELLYAVEIMLGYNAIIDCSNWDNAVITAAQNGLIKNVIVKNNMAVKSEYAVLIFFNALTADQLEQTGYGDNVQYQKAKGKTLLTDHNIIKFSGIVTAVEEAVLMGSKMVKPNCMRVGEKELHIGNTEFKSYLGYNVTCYAGKEIDDELTLLYAAPYGNSLLEINAEDILNATLNTIEYKALYDRNKIVKLSAEIDVIYNNKVIFNYKASHFKPKNGSVTLIDSDSNNIYDTAVVEDYKNFIVDDISPSKYVISDRGTGDEVCLDEYEYNQFEIIKKSQKVSFESIKKWNVVSVYSGENDEDPNDKYIRAIISDTMLTGLITEIYFDEEDVYIDNKLYKLADGFDITQLTVGKTETLLLDYKDRIAGIYKVGIGKAAAIVIDIEKKKGVDGEIMLKLFTIDNVWTVLNAAEKLTLNDTDKKKDDLLTAPELFKDGTKGGVIILYELNGKGEIKSIETAAPPTETDLNRLRNTTVKTNLRYTNYTNSFMPEAKYMEMFVNAETIIFRAPITAGLKYDDEKYGSIGYSDLKSDSYYMVEGYKTGDNAVTNIAIIYSDDVEVSDTSSLCILDRVALYVNSEGETVQKAYAYCDNTIMEIEGANGFVFSGLSKGDAFVYSSDLKGKGTDIKRYFEMANPPLKKQGTLAPSATAIVNITNSLCTMYGEVIDKIDGFIVVRFDDQPAGVPTDLTYPTDRAKVYKYTAVGGGGEIKVVTAGDIEVGNMVFMRSNRTMIMDILLIEK